MVNEDTPTSYLPELLTPRMIESNVGRHPLGLDAELGGHGVEEVDVHADDGLAVGVEELVGLVGGVGADDDLAGGLDPAASRRGLGLATWRPRRQPRSRGRRTTSWTRTR
jgi:hypothetical protein